ncbi:MAG: hypothetical protein JRJ69_10760 [Deltaproteobacteria bacterium]|nr:hypothetical protein [Deltaproteobacteria bacterium]HDH88467.1 hypothetical protein [Desulfobacteraceae bacterium]MBW2105960.1 hypothetical protein [Deltaproteobacteria bacterium]MBW2332906.1 hypothetical protein [Deltaproteobacteria bacterium]RLB17701.1 MAG: hypothetical protein DRG35_01635 [Deltaproteobacteria bacterium]
MSIDRKVIENMFNGLPSKAQVRLKRAVKLIVNAKEKGGKVAAVVGSGPNLHEGVTTLLAELIHKGIIDGVSTSSAVINHEMAGTLEKVRRFDGVTFGFEREKLPSDGFFEVSILSKERLEEIQREIPIDIGLYEKMLHAKGDIIIKVAGNMAYPTGLRTERLARDVLAMAKRCGVPFEQMAGYGADRLTMIGAGAEHNIPVLVTVPQLIGGGEVGLAVGDSLSLSERCYRIANLLDRADVIIESALALSQEVHDGPFERFTGHGIWADWEGGWTYSLADKKIVRIDLDTNLERAWMQERKSKMVTDAVHKGLPKTKLMRIPFRMEMSGFARIPGSLPIVGDIGEIWPLLATMVADALGVTLDFMSYKQSLPAGEKVREWIVKHVQPVNRERMYAAARKLTPANPQ